jgi:hypothetical protein
MKRRALIIALLVGAWCACAAREASAQVFDLSSGGQPTITGALGGSVTGSPSVTQDLVVVVNFGEVSPANTNSFVRVTVPVVIRSTDPYQVAVSVAGSFNTANAQAVQRTDLGFGVLNLRQMGKKSQDCDRSQHLFRAPFNNDPALGVTFDAQGRAAYPSTLANVGASTVILSGPRLTKGNVTKHEDDNGYIFDAVVVIKPQFYASGTFSATLTFSISPGPNVPC